MRAEVLMLLFFIHTDTSTQNYFKTKTKTKQDDEDFQFYLNKNSMETSPNSNSSRKASNYRPLLTKADSINLDCESGPLQKMQNLIKTIFLDKKFGRGISRANDENVSLVSKARMDFHAKQEQTSPFIDTPDYTFTLPDLSAHDEDFRYVLFILFFHQCQKFEISGNSLKRI